MTSKSFIKSEYNDLRFVKADRLTLIKTLMFSLVITVWADITMKF